MTTIAANSAHAWPARSNDASTRGGCGGASGPPCCSSSWCCWLRAGCLLGGIS